LVIESGGLPSSETFFQLAEKGGNYLHPLVERPAEEDAAKSEGWLDEGLLERVFG
jgi:hypothetical protein